jgi:hypothetical protein
MDELEALSGYPSDVSVSAATVARQAGSSGDIIVVLDDDPTGTQSVSDLPVLTQWLEADFDWAFGQKAPAVYVLTNTRSLMPDDAAARNREPRRHARQPQFVSPEDATPLSVATFPSRPMSSRTHSLTPLVCRSTGWSLSPRSPRRVA